MAGWMSMGARGALWLACGGIIACGGPGLEPPFQGEPAAQSGGTTATGGAFAGGTTSASGGITAGSGGDAAFTGGAVGASGGSSQPPPVVTGGAASTGGSVTDVNGGDGGVDMPPACVELTLTEVPCVFEPAPDVTGTLSASDVHVTIGQAGAASTVERVADASACAPDGYYVPGNATELQVVLCPASCAAGTVLSVHVDVGCSEHVMNDTDAGL